VIASRWLGLVAAGAAATVALAGCGSNNNTPTSGSSTTPAANKLCPSGTLTGAGSTFQAPMEDAWISAFTSQCTHAQINYTADGSGTGISEFGAGTVDFAGSDVTMKPDEQAAANKRCGSDAIHIPITAGGVAVTYNLPQVKSLRLNPAVLAGIFQGQITRWNDATIKAINPGVSLPNTAITVFHRSDASGTTAIFSGFLAATAPTWKLGTSKSLAWTVGEGKDGSAALTAGVSQTPGGIGYTEESYVQQHHLPSALIENAGGHFVQLSTANVSSALSSLVVQPRSTYDLSGKVNFKPTTANAYPISSVTYVIVCSTYPSSVSQQTVKLLKDYLTYAVTLGQNSAVSLGYAPLPGGLAGRAKASVTAIK
jgi:phosphate transport system substrate-binding protein